MPSLLVVDDEPPIREIVVRTAVRAGWTAVEASSAEEALALLPHLRVDLVCLDIRLPEQDGLTVADEIHARYPGVSVLFLTGVDDLPPAKTLRPGVAGYLIKPFNVQELFDELRRIAEQGGPDETGGPKRPRLRLVK